MPDDQTNPLIVERTASGFAVFYNLICAERGFQMPPHLAPLARGLIDDRIDKFMVIVGPGSGKSTALSEVWPAFELGHNPTTTILGISAGEALMQGFQRSVMETIEWSPIYKHLFPKVKPDKTAGWSSERGMFVTGREMGNPDASFSASGLDSKSLTGKHARVVSCDDIHDKENSGSIEQCDKVWDTWHNTILGRGDPRGARYVIAGRRWNGEDIYARHMRSGEWVVLELPAEREDSKDLWVDITIPDGLVCCFNEEVLGVEIKNDHGRKGGKTSRHRIPRRRYFE